MIEEILKKYCKILEKNNNIFLVETSLKAEELKAKLESELEIYEVKILETRQNQVKLKFVKDMFKVFQGEIKKYNDGVPPEDLKYRCEIS